MKIPELEGLIARRILLNYRVDPCVLRRLLPSPMEPLLMGGYGVAGVCLIRLEQLRPSCLDVSLPPALAMSSENAAHRVAVSLDGKPAVYIFRRDTSSRMNHWAGGRLFPGAHHLAKFTVTDSRDHVRIDMTSKGAVRVEVAGRPSDQWPADSCFPSLAAASDFFRAGCNGYSVTRASGRLDGLCLDVHDWQTESLDVERAASTLYDDPVLFPHGSIELDHALLMRNAKHNWRALDDLQVTAPEVEFGAS
ncbi:MAG: DUF2071 domain-containing protein [Myxococcales bacterium]|nr:DUF2071 domain-containing protein [Myxococcales bacterium]